MPAYRERLVPSIGIWVILVGLGAAFGLIFGPIDPTVATIAGIVMIVVLVTLGWLNGAEIQIADGQFRAGRAHIPLNLVGPAEALDSEAMRVARGTGLDARAYLCLRGWVATGVRVQIEDPKDPTPYWLISSRTPQRLVDALAGATADRPLPLPEPPA